MLSNQRWAESETYWAGLPPAVDKITGRIYLPDLKTRTTQNQEFWLRLDGGRDIQCRYAGRTIPVTTGQAVTLITLAVGDIAGVSIALANHSTGQWHALIEPSRVVHAYFYRRPSWLGTFARTAFVWLLLVLLGIFCTTVGAPMLKSILTSHEAQSILGALIAILPAPPEAHDRGETIVAIVAVIGLILIALPPLLALWRHGRRYIRFTRHVDTLTARLGQLASSC